MPVKGLDDPDHRSTPAAQKGKKAEAAEKRGGRLGNGEHLDGIHLETGTTTDTGTE